MKLIGLAIVVLITLSMLFSISEGAFLSVNRLRLRIRCKAGDKRALRVARLLKNKERIINTLLVSNDLVNVMLSATITAWALEIFGDKAVAFATFAATILLLVFGEITPKSICTRYPDAIAYGLSGFVAVVVFIMRPIVIVFTAVSRTILLARGIKVQKEENKFSIEDIKTFFDVGAETGIIEHSEKNLMNRVFKFTDLEARDIMIPRKEIVFIHIDDSYQKILMLSEQTRFSRFPVYRRNIDDIVGTVYIKDLLFYSENPKEFSVRQIMREPLFILETKNMSSIQKMLRESHQAMAIVVDEYSGTEGILTKEDIAAEMLGGSFYENAFSGADADSAASRDFVPHDKDEFSVEGGARISDIEDALRISMQSQINETIGGWFMEKSGRIAQVGDKVKFNGWEFCVEAVDNMRIASVHLKRLGE